MAGSLAARLSRIRSASKAVPPDPRDSVRASGDLGPEWEKLAPLVRRRVLCSAKIFRLPPALDPALAILCPGAASAFPDGGELDVARLLLFDLETTGLSGGAGTVAFLAAFARFEPAASGFRFRLTQYLLLDYPGEGEFLEGVLGEFSSSAAGSVLVTYNGRSFDSQILRTRCLMNAQVPPSLPHLDLVYPARRLWRRRLENCSLVTVEREALGVDRGEDMPGSEAPDAWFDFLKRGESERLLRICDHNLRDLEGLAAVLVRLEEVARGPELAAADAGRAAVDPEGLALRWNSAARTAARVEGKFEESAVLRRTARSLLELAAAAGSPRAAFSLSFDCAAAGDAARAAALRASVVRFSGAGGFPPPSPGLRASACRLLAADAFKRGDPDAALSWVREGLSVPKLPESVRRPLCRLLSRLDADQ